MGTPVMMVSGHLEINEVTRSCPEAVFLAKPFDIEYLSLQIALMVGNN